MSIYNTALVKVAVMKHYHQVFSLKSLQSHSSHLFGWLLVLTLLFVFVVSPFVPSKVKA